MTTCLFYHRLICAAEDALLLVVAGTQGTINI
jgi:hypothetical protein